MIGKKILPLRINPKLLYIIPHIIYFAFLLHSTNFSKLSNINMVNIKHKNRNGEEIGWKNDI